MYNRPVTSLHICFMLHQHDPLPPPPLPICTTCGLPDCELPLVVWLRLIRPQHTSSAYSAFVVPYTVLHPGHH